jgi:hypothetical protein
LKTNLSVLFYAYIICLIAFSFQSTNAQPYDLTGAWKDDNGSTYCIRQVGDQLSWRMNDKPRVHNVYFGTIAGQYVSGKWFDLPGGRQLGSGSLSLRIESNNRFVKIGQSANYLGSVWTRADNNLCAAGETEPPKGTRCFDGQWRGTDHIHEGCTSPQSYCKAHKVDFVFTTKNGVTELTMPDLTLKEKSYDSNTGRWEFTMHGSGGSSYGSGWFNFSRDCKSFEGRFEDNNGHRGPWKGSR